MAQKTEDQIEAPPQPLQSCEDAVKSHRANLQASLDDARIKKEQAKEQFHQWTGIEIAFAAAIKDLDEKTKAE